MATLGSFHVKLPPTSFNGFEIEKVQIQIKIFDLYQRGAFRTRRNGTRFDAETGAALSTGMNPTARWPTATTHRTTKEMRRRVKARLLKRKSAEQSATPLAIRAHQSAPR